MDTPHELFASVKKSTGEMIAAIRAVRERFGLDLRQAKEVWLQVEGIAPSLKVHEERIAGELSNQFDREDRTTEEQ